MLRYLFMACLWLGIVSVGNVSRAQLIAFPGAEGAAQFASGGRGTPVAPGDVYIVNTLEDYYPGVESTIAGSLRHGILSATGPRTIVFSVAGQINLHDRLRFNGKDNVTIAGQTAPGGGVTLAQQELTIDGSDNVILQHIRVRPGDKFPASYSNPQYVPVYDPDAIGVIGSTNVMIDHVTASWGVDETLSVTSSSNFVTVQWSTMTQGLFNAGHSALDDGVGHSYGSLLNGGNYSFHHNLYAHSKARHPRPQWNSSDARHLVLDWVNNVIYNPKDEFGNSDSEDPFSVNMVGNYGVKGPQSGSGNSSMMDPQDPNSHFYVDGNYMDTDRDILLDGAPVNGSAVFQPEPGPQFTIDPTRFDLPLVNSHTAEQAYIQVLSRAGANNYRDAIDRRTTRSVLNNLPGQIETPAGWGGFPTVPDGSAATDSNSDGVPDQWATDNGFSTMTLLHQTFAPDGYTYLEKYIHSLTPNAYALVGTAEHTVRTSFGGGSDAFVTENGGASATSGGNGSAGTLDAAFDINLNQAIVMRFDVSEIVPGSITEARLDLTAASAISGTHNFMVYALEQDNADWNWDESTVQFNDAPGLVFDGNSGTLGINNTFTTTSHPDNPGVLNLGQISVASAAAGETISLTNVNLAVFLNLAAYYQGLDSEDMVTIILQQVNSASAASFVSQEGDALLAPRLVVDALLTPVGPPVLAGDYNGDQVVNAADYTVWRDRLGESFALTNETASLGVVDQADYDAWQANFGATPAGSGSGGNSLAVPEPASLMLALAAGLVYTVGVRPGRRRSERVDH